MNTNSTFYALDTTTNLWELVRSKSFQNDPMNTPPAIDEHTAVVNEDYMYVFGGFVDGDRVNFTYKFNFKLGEWKIIILQEGTPRPSQRAGHSAVICNDPDTGLPYMYIFGGKDNEDRQLNDLWRLNL